MRERPILFSAPMVRAIQANQKTQTRRAVRLPENLHRHFGGRAPLMLALDDEGIDLYLHSSVLPKAIRCPYGKVGDRLWMREAWRTSPMFDDKPPRDLPHWAPLRYEADEALRGAWAGYGYAMNAKYRPPMFMPRWASRITLEVVGVRVERLQDISEADAIAEGIGFDPDEGAWSHGGNLPSATTANCAFIGWETAAAAYRHLWESINGPGSWDANPWVWVVEFKRAQP